MIGPAHQTNRFSGQAEPRKEHRSPPPRGPLRCRVARQILHIRLQQPSDCLVTRKGTRPLRFALSGGDQSCRWTWIRRLRRRRQVGFPEGFVAVSGKAKAPPTSYPLSPNSAGTRCAVYVRRGRFRHFRMRHTYISSTTCFCFPSVHSTAVDRSKQGDAAGEGSPIDRHWGLGFAISASRSFLRSPV